MTVFYTKRGDDGLSRLGSKKLSKDNAIFQLLGDLDELNSWIGLCWVGTTKSRKLKDIGLALKSIQKDLFIVQTEVAASGGVWRSKVKIDTKKIKNIEKVIDNINLKIPAITKFVIPGGSELSAKLDVARSLARRAERSASAYFKKKKLKPELMRYLNRLSSVLFALARLVNYKLKIKEEYPDYL